MKRKLLTILFAICFFIPCSLILSSCEKDDEPKAVSVEFVLQTDSLEEGIEYNYLKFNVNAVDSSWNKKII